MTTGDKIVVVTAVAFASCIVGMMVRDLINRFRNREPSIPPLNLPPFGTLKWARYWWEGQARLPAWAGFQSRLGIYGSEDSSSPSDGSVMVHVKPLDSKVDKAPTEAQRRAFQFQLDHDTEVRQSALKALFQHYNEIRDECMEGLNLTDEEMPKITSTEDFRRLIGLHSIHIRPLSKDGMAYVGLEFGCTWEDEHGLGILLHGSRVVEIGDCTTAFDEEPAEATGLQ